MVALLGEYPSCTNHQPLHITTKVTDTSLQYSEDRYSNSEEWPSGMHMDGNYTMINVCLPTEVSSTTIGQVKVGHTG